MFTLLPLSSSLPLSRSLSLLSLTSWSVCVFAVTTTVLIAIISDLEESKRHTRRNIHTRASTQGKTVLLFLAKRYFSPLKGIETNPNENHKASVSLVTPLLVMMPLTCTHTHIHTRHKTQTHIHKDISIRIHNNTQSG